MAKRLFLTGLACWVVAALSYGTVRLTYGPHPVYVNVRWAAGVDDATRGRLEERYRLADGELREGATWGYALTDRSRANIRALVEDPAVEDTHQIHRTAYRVGHFAQRLPYRTDRAWIPVTFEAVSLLALALGLVAAGLGAAERVAPRLVSGPLAWPRTALLSPSAAAVQVVAPVLRWIGGRIPAATAESVAAFRVVFGIGLLLFLHSRRVSAADVDPASDVLLVALIRDIPWVANWIEPWLIAWGVLFIAGAAARVSYVMFALGVFAWADLYTVDVSHHTISALMLTLACLPGSRWGDAWSVDAWRRGRAPAASPQTYGFTVWAPSLVLGVAFAGAAVAKLVQGGTGWILNGTVKYHFLSDSREALVDWGLRAIRYEGVAVLLSFAAIAIESLVVVAVLSRAYVVRLAAGVASLCLLSGFVLFQGVIWPGWWLLLLSFLPWHLVGSRPQTAGAEPTRPGAVRPRPLYPAIVALAVMTQQAVMTPFRLELSPMLSTYDMYSTTYASPAEFEEKASDGRYLVAIDETGRRHQCRLSRLEADALVAGPASGGALPPDIRQRCLDPSLRVKALTVEADRIKVDWARWRLEEAGRAALRSFPVSE